MNEISTIVDGDRMTSLQIAEITGKPHNDVMKAIRKMEPAWQKVQGGNFSLMQEEVETNNGGHKMRPYYSLNKEESLYIATKFNDEARAKLIKRWKELEEQHQKPSVPQNYLEALKSLVKSEEEKQQLALENKQQQATILTISKENMELGNKITEMLPKVSYYDKILQSNATMTITQIAQDYGMSAVRMNKELESMRIQHKVRGQWILHGQFLKGGYVHSRAVDIIRKDGQHDVKYNTEWTTKGRIFLYESLKAKGILPLIEHENTPSDKGTGGTEPAKAANSTDMIDPEIKEQLDRIEQYSLIAAKNVLNIKEAAIILGMTVRGVRENVRKHILPCYKPNINLLYFKKSELEDWMMQNRSKSMAEIESEAAAYCVTH